MTPKEIDTITTFLYWLYKDQKIELCAEDTGGGLFSSGYQPIGYFGYDIFSLYNKYIDAMNDE